MDDLLKKEDSSEALLKEGMSMLDEAMKQRWSNRTRVRVLLEYSYSYSSMKQSNRTRTRVHYQSNRTHDYFSRLHFFHMNSCKQIY